MARICFHGRTRTTDPCAACDRIDAIASGEFKPPPPPPEPAKIRRSRQYLCSICRSRAHSKRNCPQWVNPNIGRPNPNLKYKPVPAELDHDS